MGYYNVEHPDYYTRETEECDECKEEFLTGDGAEFFCHANGKDYNFCCETCMCNRWLYYFRIAYFHYAESIADFIFDNDFTCSHPNDFESEWIAYRDTVKKMSESRKLSESGGF